MNYQPMTIAYKRTILARMLQDGWADKRHVKLKDSIVEVEEQISISMIVRIIALDTKLAALEKKEQQAQRKQDTQLQSEPNQETPAEVVPAASTQSTPVAPPVPAPVKAAPPKKETVKEAFKRKALERMAAKQAGKV